VSDLEDDKAALQRSLSDEREALADARRAVSGLQKDLSELQAVSAATSVQSASDKVSGGGAFSVEPECSSIGGGLAI
jgi:hypothetical protein